MKRINIGHVNTKEQLKQMLCGFHNSVNARTGSPQYSVDGLELYKRANFSKIFAFFKQEIGRPLHNRQLSDATFRNLARGKFEPYFPSEDIQERFREIANSLGDPNIFREVESTLRLMTSEFRSLPLNGAFDVELNDYLFEDIATPPLPNLPQPTVNTQANVQNVDPTTNLTSTETALLSPEEQVIRQRLRRTT